MESSAARLGLIVKWFVYDNVLWSSDHESVEVHWYGAAKWSMAREWGPRAIDYSMAALWVLSCPKAMAGQRPVEDAFSSLPCCFRSPLRGRCVYVPPSEPQNGGKHPESHRGKSAVTRVRARYAPPDSEDTCEGECRNHLRRILARRSDNEGHRPSDHDQYPLDRCGG